MDDIMQQVWLQARNTSLKLCLDQAHAWMLKVAGNLINADVRKAARRDRSRSHLARSMAARLMTESLPHASLESTEARQTLWLAITELPPDQQDLIVQRYLHGLNVEQIAELGQVSPKAIEGRLYRARTQLHVILDQLAKGGL